MWMGIWTETGMEMGEERTDPSSDWRLSTENKEGLVGVGGSWWAARQLCRP